MSRYVFWAFTLVCAGIAVLWPPMAQPLSYHDFADCRSLLSLPNFMNVASNLPFLLAGALGLARVISTSSRFIDARERLPYIVFFLGALLTCFGSMYYHWAPDNARLVWDRLPMTMAFAGLVAAVLSEREDLGLGQRAFWPVLIIGAGSVFWWYATERRGVGNVIPYGVFQGWAIVAVLALLLNGRPSRYTHLGGLWWAVALYAGAKFFETFDLAVYRALGATVSGHTIKHLIAAGAVYAIARMLLERSPAAPAPAGAAKLA